MTPVIDTGSEILVPWLGINGAGTFSCCAGAKPKLQQASQNYVKNFSNVKQFFKHHNDLIQ